MLRELQDEDGGWMMQGEGWVNNHGRLIDSFFKLTTNSPLSFNWQPIRLFLRIYSLFASFFKCTMCLITYTLRRHNTVHNENTWYCTNGTHRIMYTLNTHDTDPHWKHLILNTPQTRPTIHTEHVLYQHSTQVAKAMPSSGGRQEGGGKYI